MGWNLQQQKKQVDKRMRMTEQELDAYIRQYTALEKECMKSRFPEKFSNEESTYKQFICMIQKQAKACVKICLIIGLVNK